MIPPLDNDAQSESPGVSSADEARAIARSVRLSNVDASKALHSGWPRNASRAGCSCGCLTRRFYDDPSCVRHQLLDPVAAYRAKVAAERAAEGRATAEDLDLLRVVQHSAA